MGQTIPLAADFTRDGGGECGALVDYCAPKTITRCWRVQMATKAQADCALRHSMRLGRVPNSLEKVRRCAWRIGSETAGDGSHRGNKAQTISRIPNRLLKKKLGKKQTVSMSMSMTAQWTGKLWGTLIPISRSGWERDHRRDCREY